MKLPECTGCGWSGYNDHDCDIFDREGLKLVSESPGLRPGGRCRACCTPEERDELLREIGDK